MKVKTLNFTLSRFVTFIPILLLISNVNGQWAWKPIGPAPLDHSTFQYGNPLYNPTAYADVSARVNSIAVSENFDGKGTPAIFIAPEGGGIWRGTDFEKHNPKWINITDNLCSNTKDLKTKYWLQTASQIIVDPNNPNIIYALISHNISNHDVYSVITKSIDGGNTWNIMPRPGNGIIAKIIIDATDKTGNSVYALAFSEGLYKWDNTNKVWNATLTKGLPIVNLPIGSINAYYDCDYSLYNNNFTFYIAVKNNGKGEIWKSTDRGGYWTRIPFYDKSTWGTNNPTKLYGLGGGIYSEADIDNIIITSTHSTKKENIKFAVYAGDAKNVGNLIPPGIPFAENEPSDFLVNLYHEEVNTQAYNGIIPQALFTDHWKNLDKIGTSSHSYAFAYNPYQNQYYIAGTYDIKKSNIPDEGWIDIHQRNVMPHCDNHALAFYKDHVFLGNDGGIYDYSINKDEWFSLNNNTLQTILANSVSIHPQKPWVQVIGTQDNYLGVNTLDPKNANGFGKDLRWYAYYPLCNLITKVAGDVGKLYFNSDGSLLYAGSAQYDGKGIAENNQFIERTSNLGIRWDCVGPQDAVNNKAHLDWYPPIAIHPTDPNKLAIGLDRVYESVDQGNSWGSGAISPVLRANQQSSAIMYGSDNKIWVAYYDALSIQKNRNNLNPTDPSLWQTIKISDGNTNLAGRIVSIVENSDNPKTKYIATSAGDIWKTDDDGTTWRNITNNLKFPINKLKCVKTHNEILLFVATDMGVYYCFDKGNGGACGDYQWIEFNNGLPFAKITDIDYNKQWDYIAVSTWGRGVYHVFMNDVFNSGAFNTDDIPRADIIDYNTPLNECTKIHSAYKGYKFYLSLSLNKIQACTADNMVQNIDWKVQAFDLQGNKVQNNNNVAFYPSMDNYTITFTPPTLKMAFYITITATVTLKNGKQISATVPKFLISSDPNLTNNMVLLQVQDDNGKYINYDSYIQSKYGYYPLKDCKSNIYGKADILLPNKKYRLTVQSPSDYEQLLSNYFGINFSSLIEYSCAPFDFKCTNKVLPLGQPKQNGKKPGEWIEFISGPNGSGLKIKLNITTKDGCKTTIEMPYSVKQPIAGVDFPSASIIDLSNNSLDGCHYIYDTGKQLTFILDLKKPACAGIKEIHWDYYLDGPKFGDPMFPMFPTCFSNMSTTDITKPFVVSSQSKLICTFLKQLQGVSYVNAEVFFKDGSIINITSPAVFTYYDNIEKVGDYLGKLQVYDINLMQYVDYDWKNKKDNNGQYALIPNGQFRFTLRTPNEIYLNTQNIVNNYSISYQCQGMGCNSFMNEMNKMPADDNNDKGWSHFSTGASGAITINLSTQYKNGCSINKALLFTVNNPVPKSSKEEQGPMQWVSNNTSIDIIPNPNSGIFSISMPDNITNAKVEITDAAGRSIIKKNINQISDNRFNLSNYAKGIYYIKIQADKYSASKKVVIQ